MPKKGFIILLLGWVCVCVTPARAELSDRLSEQRFGAIPAGNFSAGDLVRFSLSHYRNEYLMQFAGEPEIYVLYAGYSSLGGQVLRYDSGAIAIKVAGWGAMTIYTDSYPGGLPVDRTGKADDMTLPRVTQSELVNRAEDEGAHLAYVRSIHAPYVADWKSFAEDPAERALVYDTLENAARGIVRFTANAEGRAAFARHITQVHFETSYKPTIRYSNHTLVVTFNPGDGFRGRASSRAIAFALGKMFHIPFPN